MSDSLPYRPKKLKEKSPAALELLDESFHRLRTAPIAILGVYYAGTLPFILGFLYFCADLSENPDAERHGAGTALGLALLFLWMKTCQAVFARRLRRIFNRRPAERWSAGALVNLFVVQSVLHSIGLFVLLVGSILTFPVGWAYAFCQSATAVGAGDEGTVREVLRRTLRGAVLWPKQNHVMLLILTLLGMFVWINVFAAMAALPYAAKMFTGEENIYTLSGTALLNSTFFSVSICIVYLLLDPLIKTFYALRCFYAESQLSGEDLKSELRSLPVLRPAAAPGETRASSAPRPRAVVPAGAAVFAAACLLTGLAPGTARAGLSAAPPPAAVAGKAPVIEPAAANRVKPPELNKSIEEVLRRREFAWRMPHAEEAAPARGVVEKSLDWIGDTTSNVGSKISKAWDTLWDWFWKYRRSVDGDKDRWSSGGDQGSSGWFNGGGVFLQRLIYGLIALIACALTYQLWKHWQRRAAPTLAGEAAPSGAAATPDLSDEDIMASQLPEDEWMQLARRLLAAGEHRLALRAFYLSVLALLGGSGLLAIARHKSNRDYLGELRRRARDRADLQLAFTRNVSRYERVWYGPHAAGQEVFDQFLADRQVIADAIAAGV